jgi:hypothetical protein
MEWNTTRLKKGIPQNDSNKILKIEITTNLTTHLIALPSQKRKEKVCTNFTCSVTRWKLISEDDKSQIYEWKERSKAQRRYSKNFLRGFIEPNF